MERVQPGPSHPSTTPVPLPADVPPSPSPSGSSRRRSRRAAVAPRAWLPRTAVLTALALATIAVPLLDHGREVATVDVEAVSIADPRYPSAYEVLAGEGANLAATSVLAAVRGTDQLSGTASRAYDRDPLPGCDGQARPAGSNGLIPASDLCALWVSGHLLRGDAAVALAELNFNFRAAFGRDLCLTDSYRSLAEQRRVAAVKPGLAASPGTSNHGWGLAIDLCTSENRSAAVMEWLQDNGPTFGWDNPQWARRGGSGAYEPWHWEYVPGTSEMGTNY